MAYAKVLTALADPTRRAIFETLRKHQGSVQQISQTVTVSRPAVSQHLKVLEGAGLVRATADGTRRIYRAVPEGLRPLQSYLEGYWSDVLDAFAEHVTNEEAKPND